MEGYWVYILRCSDSTLYTGWTNDVDRRLAAHSSGRGSRYTRARLPVTLCYLERAAHRSQAMKREAEIKKLSRSSKLLLCADHPGSRGHSSR